MICFWGYGKESIRISGCPDDFLGKTSHIVRYFADLFGYSTIISYFAAEFAALQLFYYRTKNEYYILYKGKKQICERILRLDADRYQKGDLPLSNLLSKYCSYIAQSN